MRTLFLNQYFPPDPAPTGLLFAEIAGRLREDGHEVEFIDSGEDYRASQGQGGRMRREAASLLRMLRRGIATRRPDVVVSGTSPPCLLMVAQVIALRHRARSIHWCMDLYPDIALALGEIQPGLLSRLITAVMGWSYRRAARVVALDADMAERIWRHGVETEIIRPWVMGSATRVEDQVPGDPWTWLYSGNLGRAHEWETLLAAQKILETRGVPARLVFQGGGPSVALARDRAQELGLQRVEWRPYAPMEELESSLLSAHCLIVTERPEVRGMLWPSKLALILALPRPILFVGPVDGAIARELQPHPHAAVFAPGSDQAVADWVTERVGQGFAKPGSVLDASAHRHESLERLAELILNLSS